jgi:hypothetical protein
VAKNVRLSGKAGTRREVRRLIAIVTLAAALLALGAFPAIAGGPNNVVVAESTADPVNGAAGTVVRSRVLTGSTGADEVTSTNLASAHSHDCTGCRATAVAFQAVQLGRCDALVLDVPIVGLQKKTNPSAYGPVAGQIVTHEKYGAVLAKNSKLAPMVDKAITQLTSDGTIAKLQKKWFSISFKSVPVLK